MVRISPSTAVRLANVGEEIRQTPPLSVDLQAYTARILVLATLPHRDPGDIPVWRRVNGWFSMTIQATTDRRGRRVYPWGTIPRLLLYWVVGEALKNGSRRIELSQSLAEFMRQIGLNPATGGGKRGDAQRLAEQMERLFRAQISIEDGQDERRRWLTMPVTEAGELWWTARSPHQHSLFRSYIILGDGFFRAITDHAFPVDRRALRVLKQSPLALDLYAWLSYRIHHLGGRSVTLSWESLRGQLGACYNDTDNFAKAARKALKAVAAVYPGLSYECPRGRLTILPSRPAVPARNLRITELIHGEMVPCRPANDSGPQPSFPQKRTVNRCRGGR